MMTIYNCELKRKSFTIIKSCEPYYKDISLSFFVCGTENKEIIILGIAQWLNV